ncbi:MAG: baseplate J/gp47 family protein [Pyrinomonadaceae bacterium]
MPLQIPKIDDRRYQDLLDEALARIPVHNPEWTNFNRSDPGVTLIELFAFMTESLLYRANLIPERNRLKFLQLLGIPLQPAASAQGLVVLTNERGGAQTVTLKANLEARAGQVPFRTVRGLDVLPVEGRVYYKKPIVNDPLIIDYYSQLYASFQETATLDIIDFQLYETTLLDGGSGETGVTLGQDTIDGSLWIALLARENAKPENVLEEIAGKTLSLGIVPALDETSQSLRPAGLANLENTPLLIYELPKLPPGGKLSADPEQRVLEYKPLDARSETNVLTEPGIVEITLPSVGELKAWLNLNLDPLESGADDFPPSLEDTKLSDRLVTWLRVRPAAAAARVRLLWVGINAAQIVQKAHVELEVLPNGNGEPDQVAKLSRTPVVPRSVQLWVETKEWSEIDDLLAAGSEVAKPNLRQQPGAKAQSSQNSEVFMVNPEAGEIRFGDGSHGKRPPQNGNIRVAYDYGVGAAGNVGANSINASPGLPAGLKVTNPVRTWGGTDAETVSAGEKQITRFLQHRDRLVTVNDFETIALRTPGVEIGRVEIIPAFNPKLAPNEPGDAPGAVTVMVIPRFDAKQPDAPQPDRIFLAAVCRYLDERRLVTTEIIVTAPVYKPIWISIGINVVASYAVSEVREAVKKVLTEYLAPLGKDGVNLSGDQILLLTAPERVRQNRGWRLRKPVTAQEILAAATRVEGVLFVNQVLLAQGDSAPQEQVPMNGLELPRILGISVAIGDAVSLNQLRGQATPGSTGTKKRRTVPIPVIPEEC